MALTRQTVIDLIEIDEWMLVRYRVTKRIFDDTDQVGERHQAFLVEPGDDTTGLPQPVRAICNLLHTQAVIDAWAVEKARRRVVL